MTNIKVGDRVKVIKNGMFNRDRLGKEGVVIVIRDAGNPRVRFDDGEEDYGYTSDLEVIAPAAPPAPAIPDEIEINGAKYRRVIEEAAPEKPEPKAGQVWRWAGNITILSDRPDWEQVTINGGSAGAAYHHTGRFEFIAPTLADALERGLITAADLR